MMVLQVEYIVAGHRVHQAVDRRILRVFRLESAEHEVPDNENTCVILVNVLRVTTVMDAMMRWRVDDVLKGSKFGDHFGVDPEHV